MKQKFSNFIKHSIKLALGHCPLSRVIVLVYFRLFHIAAEDKSSLHCITSEWSKTLLHHRASYNHSGYTRPSIYRLHPVGRPYLPTDTQHLKTNRTDYMSCDWGSRGRKALYGESVCWSTIQRGWSGPLWEVVVSGMSFSAGWKMVGDDPALVRSYVEREYSVVVGDTA